MKICDIDIWRTTKSSHSGMNNEATLLGSEIYLSMCISQILSVCSRFIINALFHCWGIDSNCFGYKTDFSKAGVIFCYRRIFPHMEPVILTNLIMCHWGIRVCSFIAFSMWSLSCEVTFKLSLVKVTIFTASIICSISIMISTLLIDSRVPLLREGCDGLVAIEQYV